MSPFVAGMLAAAVTCAGLALAIGTEAWAAWMAHGAPAQAPATRQGAALWRTMLGVTAVMLVLAALVLRRLTPLAPAGPPGRARPWTLLGLVVVALALRVSRLTESLWYDEIASWMAYAAGAGTVGAVIANFSDPVNHPLHTILSLLSVRWLAGTLGVEAAFRAPALVFSLLAVPAVAGLARAVASERVATIAAGLAAGLPVAVLAGTEARGYSMMIFFAAIMTWLMIEARRRAARACWAAYALACALGIWSHFVAVFVPAGHGAWLAWRAGRHGEWREAGAGAVALALGATLTLTLYAPMIPGAIAGRALFVTERGDGSVILGTEGLQALLQLGGSWYWWAAAPGLGLALLGLVGAKADARAASPGAGPSPGAGIAPAMVGLPLMVAAVALAGSWIYARFTLFALPGAIVLIAIGIDALWRRRRVAALAALGLVAACAVADLSSRPPKQPLRDAAEYVRVHGRAGDRVLAVGLGHAVLDLYGHGLDVRYSLGHGRDLRQQLALVQPHWLIVEFPRSVPEETWDLIRRAGLGEVARLAGWMDWTNGDVIVHRRR